MTEREYNEMGIVVKSQEMLRYSYELWTELPLFVDSDIPEYSRDFFFEVANLVANSTEILKILRTVNYPIRWDIQLADNFERYVYIAQREDALVLSLRAFRSCLKTLEKLIKSQYCKMEKPVNSMVLQFLNEGQKSLKHICATLEELGIKTD